MRGLSIAGDEGCKHLMAAAGDDPLLQQRLTPALLFLDIMLLFLDGRGDAWASLSRSTRAASASPPSSVPKAGIIRAILV